MRLLIKTALTTLLLDQVTKFLVVNLLDLDGRQEIAVLPPFLQFRMAWNEGINFGFLSSSGDLGRWVLIGLALAIAVWIWRWAGHERGNRRVQISAGLLIGGALGNVIDRLLYGAVADFLNMGLPWFDNPFSFNVADVAIFFGALGLVFFSRQGKGADKTP